SLQVSRSPEEIVARRRDRRFANPEVLHSKEKGEPKARPATPRPLVLRQTIVRRGGLVDTTTRALDNRQAVATNRTRTRHGGTIDDQPDDQGDPDRPGARGRRGRGRGLGPDPARLEGRLLVPPGPRRIVLRTDPGGGRGVAAELSG